MKTSLSRRRLPWLCGCHDPAVFGHLMPCAWWQTQARPGVPLPGPQR